MTIGARFRALLDDCGMKPSALAAKYRKRALRRARDFPQDVIETHLSRLEKDEPSSVRFFFANAPDAVDLLELLSVPKENQDAFHREARDLLHRKASRIRVVIDLSDKAEGRAIRDACDALLDKIIQPISDRIALVVTHAQRDYLPPRCTPEGLVDVQVVEDAGQGWIRTRKLAGNGAVVISGRRFEPVFRWIALEQHGDCLLLEPADGIIRIIAGDPFDPPKASVSLRRLELLVGDVAASNPPKELTNTPRALRSLLAKLESGQPVLMRHSYWGSDVSVDAKTRAAWGKALEASAVATASEWGDALVTRVTDAGVAMCVAGGASDLDSHLAAVARGGSTPRAVRVGGKVHVINASPALRAKLQDLHGVRFHDEARRQSPFERIEKLVQTISWEAWLDDPYMDAAMARIDPEGRDREELEFARASLLLHDKLAPVHAPCVRDWRTTLTEILAHESPAVGVRVSPTCKVRGTAATLLPESEVRRRASRGGVELHGIPALVPPRVVRNSPLLALTQRLSPSRRGDRFQNSSWGSGSRFLLPRATELGDLETLLDLLTRSPARVGSSKASHCWWKENESKHLLGLEWEEASVPMDEHFWRGADATLAALWIALRRAARDAHATALPDGTAMLEMGGGVVALIQVTLDRTAADERVEADFWCDTHSVSSRGRVEHPTASILRKVGTRVAQVHGYETRIATEVPTRLFLSQGAACLQITFEATPWQPIREPLNESELAAAVAAVRRVEHDRRMLDE
ncbi:MAG: hypothetical protein Q8Q09_22340 [Deltaproteobacteria bacterium]|nr:hypothetical protein [Deltaproteobacteria bacterium]